MVLAASPLLLLLSEAGTAAVYTTADLVLQGRERNSERVVVDVGAAIVRVQGKHPSVRTIARVVAPAEPNPL